MQVDPAQENLFNEIMSGVDLIEIEPRLHTLSPDSRQSLLCALCGMHREIARICRQPAELISTLLSLKCPLYVDGHPTCEEGGLARQQSV